MTHEAQRLHNLMHTFSCSCCHQNKIKKNSKLRGEKLAFPYKNKLPPLHMQHIAYLPPRSCAKIYVLVLAFSYQKSFFSILLNIQQCY